MSGYKFGVKSVWVNHPASVDMLRDCIALRMSASETAAKISKEFGVALTPGAAVGKSHRLGIRFDSENRHNTFAKHGQGKARQARAAPRAPKPEKLHKTVFYPRPAPIEIPAEPVAIPESRRVSIGELTFHSCRWPLGDPRHSDFAFCGADRVNPYDDSNAYCAGHAVIAYRPVGQVNLRPVRQAYSTRAGVES
jgi:GcrA cell cycle regulator